MMKRYLTLTVVLVGLAGCGTDLSAILGGALGSSGSDKSESGGNPQPESQVAQLQQFTSQEELKQYLVDQAGQPFGFDLPLPVPTSGMTTEQQEDLIENDGEYLYVFSHGVLHIVQAQPAEEMAEVSSVDLDSFSAFDMYLVGDRVVTITMPEPQEFAREPVAITTSDSPAAPFCQPQVEVTVIDVADRANPVVLSRSRLDGMVNATHMVDDRLHLVVANHVDFSVDGFSGDLEPSPSDVPLDDVLPDITIEVNGREVFSGDLAGFSNHYRPVDPDGPVLTTLVSMDIDSPQDYRALTVVGEVSNVHASTQALYLTDGDDDRNGEVRENTDIYKFAFTDEGTPLAAAGTVPGRVLHDAMGEHNGFLRLVTAAIPMVGTLDAAAPSSNIYVLEQNGDRLELAGSVEDLAPGESIFVARFIGDKAYLVTFEQVARLLTLDLSDPRNPRAMGELDMPGLCTAVIPMGHDHLLTIGESTDDESAFAGGVQLSILDVSDLANPRLAYTEVIDPNGAHSEALFNPKALAYFAEGDLLALPVEILGFGFDLLEPGEILFDDADQWTQTHEGDLPGLPMGVFDFGFGPGEPGLIAFEDGGARCETHEGGLAEFPMATFDVGLDPVGPGMIAFDDTGVWAGAHEGEEPDDWSASHDEPIDTTVPPPPEDLFVGLYVYRVTAEDGFEFVGRIGTARDEAGFFYGPEFTRGVFIGNTVYAVTSDGVQAASIDNVGSILSTVVFPFPYADVPLPEELR